MPRVSGPTTSAAAHAALAKPAASTSVPLETTSATQYASAQRTQQLPATAVALAQLHAHPC